jgi:hypothetical protein
MMPTTARSSLLRSTATRRPGSIDGRNVRKRLDAYAPHPPTCAIQNHAREDSDRMAPTYFFFISRMKILLMMRHSPCVLSSDM